ncbi:MAG TPA: glutamate racemase [Bacteroidia bacterium]|nr:glutamate racemase [Bacteroidia bacterium]
MISSSANNPIGVFDSGIGGLTVAAAMHQILPNEQLIYFGDTAHLPYGDKSPDNIKEFAKYISAFLLERNCKVIVIACNTASAIAYQTVKNEVKNKALVINVIDPVIDEVIKNGKSRHVGIIGTKGTIKSGAYSKRIKKLSSKVKVSSMATPLLAPMIEEGFYNNKISRTIISDYLSRPYLTGIDALVLACTHYPLIKSEIVQHYKNKIHIYDSANIVAQYVKEMMLKNQLISTVKPKKHKFYVSDYTTSFAASASRFFKDSIQLELYDLWNYKK